MAMTIAIPVQTICRIPALSHPDAPVRDVDPVDLGDAETVEQRDDRKDERIGLRCDNAHGNVHRQYEHRESGRRA